uniref:RIKEN cDNA 1700016H13 gene n=2 Tax=Nannospalax galili TaxID=1026970 RepID=A0A8C6RME1_NANGA
AYGLPRRNTVKAILRGSCYKVQEPWDLASLTKTWYMNIANIKLPFLGEITFGSPVKLTPCKTNKDGLLPSAEAIKVEKEYEMKHLMKLKCREDAYAQVCFPLREKQGGLRRPLQPK